MWGYRAKRKKNLHRGIDNCNDSNFTGIPTTGIQLSHATIQCIRKVKKRMLKKLRDSQVSEEDSKFKVPITENASKEYIFLDNLKLVHPKYTHSISTASVSEFYEKVKDIPKNLKYEASLVIIDFLKTFEEVKVSNLWIYIQLLQSKNPSRNEKLRQVYKILSSYLKFIFDLTDSEIPRHRKLNFLRPDLDFASTISKEEMHNLYIDIAKSGNFKLAIAVHLMYSCAMDTDTVSYLTFECCKEYGFLRYWDCSDCKFRQIELHDDLKSDLTFLFRLQRQSLEGLKTQTRYSRNAREHEGVFMFDSEPSILASALRHELQIRRHWFHHSLESISRSCKNFVIQKGKCPKSCSFSDYWMNKLQQVTLNNSSST